MPHLLLIACLDTGPGPLQLLRQRQLHPQPARLQGAARAAPHPSGPEAQGRARGGARHRQGHTRRGRCAAGEMPSTAGWPAGCVQASHKAVTAACRLKWLRVIVRAIVKAIPAVGDVLVMRCPVYLSGSTQPFSAQVQTGRHTSFDCI